VGKYNVRLLNQFKRDLRVCVKRGYEMSLLREVMAKLEIGESLDVAVNRPQRLSGTNPAIIECHIKADWLLEYRFFGDELIFIRTGTHSDLF